VGIVAFDRRRRLALPSLVAFAALAASPGHAATRTAQSQTVVIRPATLVNTAPLSFGNLLSGPTPGTVTVSTAGARTTTGGVTPAGGSVTAANFVGMNDSGGFLNLIRVTIPAGTITLNRVGGGAAMTMNNLTSSLGPGIFGSDYYFMGSNTVFSFSVGGRLNVAANQMIGTYTGTFTVTVDYQ
jgi:hypothetical protein